MLNTRLIRCVLVLLLAVPAGAQLVRTDIGAWVSTTDYGTAAFSTGSFTPPVNSLLLVTVGRFRNAGTGDIGAPTVSGGGLTYTNVGSAHKTASWAGRWDVFRAAVGGSPAAMTVTVDDSGNAYDWQVSVIAFTGYDTGTPVAGFVSTGTTNAGDGSETVTLAATPTADDVTILFIGGDAGGNTFSPTLASGWSIVHDVTSTAGDALATARRESSTSTTVTVTDVYGGSSGFSWASVGAFIVKAAAGGVAPHRRGTVIE